MRRCLAQLGDPAIVVAAVPVGDLQVGLRHLHLRVELERASELGDRLLDQALLVVEDAEVVVRPGVGRVDPTGKGAEHREIALRERGGRHDVRAVRMASKMDRSDAMSGSSRKWPPSGSAAPFDPERGLHTEGVLAVVPEVQVGVVRTAPLRSMTRLGTEGTSIIPMKSLSAFRYALAENVSGLLQAGLLHLAEVLGGAELPPKQKVAQDARRTARETAAAPVR